MPFSMLKERKQQKRGIWNSPYRHKPYNLQRLYISNPTAFPVASMHLAAISIQSGWRGWRARKHFRIWAMQVLKSDPKAIEEVRKIEVRKFYLKYFEATGEHHEIDHFAARIRRTKDAEHKRELTLRFKHWAATRIQKMWRLRRIARREMFSRHVMYTVAAIEIQRTWRDNKRRQAVPFVGPHGPRRAATAIQRAWRGYTSKRIYCYFRDLIVQRQNSDPVLLLKNLNPREAPLVDQASGLYVRFRLGGMVFPPIIYYKIYTKQAITDINAFAPRDYVKERNRSKGPRFRKKTKQEEQKFGSEEELRAYWYKRWENNGWRPISDKLLLEDDPIVRETAAKKIDYHHNKLVRQVDLLKKRKRKKLLWLKKMYMNGHVKTEDPNVMQNAQDEASELMEKLLKIDETSEDVFNKDWEDDADELLDWSNGLNFEDYQDDWFIGATSRPADKHFAEDIMGLMDEGDEFFDD